MHTDSEVLRSLKDLLVIDLVSVRRNGRTKSGGSRSVGEDVPKSLRFGNKSR